MRAAGSDHTVVLKRPRPITLEYALDYINSDELVEVTPNFIRLRKRILNTEERKKADAKKNKQTITKPIYFFGCQIDNGKIWINSLIQANIYVMLSMQGKNVKSFL